MLFSLMPPVGMNFMSGYTGAIDLMSFKPPTASAGNSLTAFRPY